MAAHQAPFNVLCVTYPGSEEPLCGWPFYGLILQVTGPVTAQSLLLGAGQTLGHSPGGTPDPLAAQGTPHLRAREWCIARVLGLCPIRDPAGSGAPRARTSPSD